MKKLVLVAMVCCSTLLLEAQNLVYTPEQHRVDTVIYENFEAYDINMTTPSPEAITFKWKMISNTLLPSWSYSLCDYGACYVGIPTTTETMSSISLSAAQSGTQGFLKLNITVGQNYGSGKVVFYVYDAANINRGDTISMEVIWLDPLSVAELTELDNEFLVYPNPTTGNFKVENLTDDKMKVTLTNLLGEVVFTNEIMGNSIANFDASTLPKGVYFLVTEADNRKGTKKIILN